MRTWGQGRGLKSFDEITCKANGTSLLSLSYTYDAAGNIQTVSKSGTVYDQYAYDELGQLIREDNKDANKSYTYTYDSRGNILEKKTYAFTLGTLGTAQKTDSYGYATDSWKDRLTSYNGQTITYDAIGNPLTYNNGSAYTFTWEGRQMQTATKGNTTWTYTYNADGLRTGKTNGTTTYTYTWNENRQLSSMTWNTGYALFYYDANGTPNSVVIDDGYDVQTYCYVTNLQGDIVGLISAESGDWAVTYEYDAWGNLLDKKGYSSGYAGAYVYNPLTYKGYLYDEETGFYYLQSRYYDPTIGRFLNADFPESVILQKDNSILASNLFCYCFNDSINHADYSGYVVTPANVVGAVIGLIGGAVIGTALANHFKLGWPWKGLVIGSVSVALTVVGWFAGPAVYAAVRPLVTSAIATCTVVFNRAQEWILKALGLSQIWINQALRLIDAKTVRFSQTVLNHLNGDRPVPIQTLIDAIKSGRAVPDPQGVANRVMYYCKVWVNGKQYQVEVLVNWATKTIEHYLYKK